MSVKVSLKAAPRKSVGKNGVNKARKSGLVPAVLYGRGEPQPIEIKSVELAKALHNFAADHVLVDLEVEGSKSRLALVQDVQHHPIKDTILHVDFQELDENKKMHTEVPLIALGEPVGVRTGGGILDQTIRFLRIACLPKDLPAQIEFDVNSLELNQSIHLRDIKAPEGVTILNPADLTVFIVQPPVAAVEETPAAGTTAEAAAGSPEVIKEKKTEEEGAASAGDAKASAKPAAKPAK